MEIIIAFLLSIMTAWVGWGEVSPVSAPDVPSTTTAHVVRVIDGDTIVVEIEGVQETVRYIGIDTPEPYRDGQPACFSSEASVRNVELVAGREVLLIADSEDRDRYDRLLRYVYVDKLFVNEQLMIEGYATTLSIPPNTTHAASFQAAKEYAREAGLGLWSACAGQVDT